MARVLVIDDDEEYRTLVRHMLVGEGHQVDEALDGAEGLRLFGKSPPDLVLTDINMPGLDGHEVITAIRVLHPEVPIIAVSGGGCDCERRAPREGLGSWRGRDNHEALRVHATRRRGQTGACAMIDPEL